MSKKKYIIPIFIPHIGCPNQCVFCNQKNISGAQSPPENIEQTIEEHLSYFGSNIYEVELAFYGGSFTAIPVETQRDYLSKVQPYLQSGVIDCIRISTRPDAITEDILQFLWKYGVRIIELGVQSLSKTVLQLSKRNHTVQDVYGAVECIRKHPFKVGLQMMVGLLGDGGFASLYTAYHFTKIRPDFVRVYPTMVIKQTELEMLYNNKIFTPLSLKNMIDICSQIQILFEYHSISIIRMGLQASKDLQREHIAAGAYHPAFRQMVDSQIYFDFLTPRILKIHPSKKISIWVPAAIHSSVVGNNKANLQHWKNRGYHRLRVKSYKEDRILLEVEDTLLYLDFEAYISDAYQLIISEIENALNGGYHFEL